MHKKLFAVSTICLITACTATEFKVDQPSLSPDQIAILEVSTRSVGDYLNDNIRIKHIKQTNGDTVLEHPWYLPHTVTAHITAPQSYEVTLLCEKPLKLRFEHPTATIDVSPGCYYSLSCDWSQESVSVASEAKC
ncbi:MAG: hypothetical protein MI867_01660 [Pseudomonadales bacterium]|nr:hypothetical protein [Pseudomonadales bacterium]